MVVGGERRSDDRALSGTQNDGGQGAQAGDGGNRRRNAGEGSQAAGADSDRCAGCDERRNADDSDDRAVDGTQDKRRTTNDCRTFPPNEIGRRQRIGQRRQGKQTDSKHQAGRHSRQ